MTSSTNDQTKSFNYAGAISKPDTTRSENIFSMITNLRDSLDYLKGTLADGKDCRGNSLTLGNSFFAKTGKCSKKFSVDACKGKDRYIYVNNVPSEYPSCSNPFQPMDERCKSNGKTGLVPGALMDFAQINPMELVASSLGVGSVVNDVCVQRKELVGKVYGGKDLRVYEERCAPAKRNLICNFEFFDDYSPSPSFWEGITPPLLLTFSLALLWVLRVQRGK